MNERTAEDRMRYAKQFDKALITGNVQQLSQLSPDKRIHVMKALSNLAKFSGRYDSWMQIRQHFNLKQTSGNESLQSFDHFFKDELNYNVMLQHVSKLIQKLPSAHANYIKFGCLTG